MGVELEIEEIESVGINNNWEWRRDILDELVPRQCNASIAGMVVAA